MVWYIVYSLGGKRKWEKVGWSSCYTVTYAQQLRAECVRKSRRHTKAVPARRTLGEAWAIARERYISRLAGAGNTLSIYRLHIAPHLADLQLTAISIAHVERVKDAMADKSLSPQTVRHALGLIRRIYDYMMKWGLYSGLLPTTAVAVPRSTTAAPGILRRRKPRCFWLP